MNYDRAGAQHYFQFNCSAPISERERLAEEVRKLPGVVEVLTLMTGQQNVTTLAAGVRKGDITDLAYDIDGIGLSIKEVHLVRDHVRRPFAGFRSEDIP